MRDKNVKLLGLRSLALLSVSALALTGSPNSPAWAESTDLPQVRFVSQGLAPEGVAYDAGRRRFLVSSIANGTLNAVDEDGTVRIFAQDPSLKGTLGVKVDADRNRVLVVDHDPAILRDPKVKGRAGLAAFDLQTGRKLFYANLTPLTGNRRTFPNDVTIAPDGTAYVTDSFGDGIYRVGTDGRADVLVRAAQFRGTPVTWLGNIDFGLGGLDYHPDGFLLTTHNGKRKLYKVSLGERPRVAEVAMAAPFAGDGLVLSPAGALHGAAFGEVKRVESTDGWRSARITAVARGHEPVTTLTWRDGRLYGLYAYIGADPQPQAYRIVRIDMSSPTR